MKAYISQFQPHEIVCTKQEAANSWLANYHAPSARSYLEKFSVSEKLIESRAIYAPGIIENKQSGNVFALDEKIKPDIAKKSQSAQETIENIFKDLYKDTTQAPEYLNHVSCTHYHSPSAAQLTVVSKEWFERTDVTHLYHMGCYAAMPALRVACAYIDSGAKHIDTVHTEVCSYHLDKDEIKPEQIIMKTLFADGAIKYSYSNQERFERLNQDGLEVLTQHEVLVPGSDKEMSWKINPNGFGMSLSRNVPAFLADGIKQYMQQMFLQAELNFEKDKDDVLFAIHPGGPKIIEVVAEALNLNARQIEHSKYILKTRGNMSSATIPYIWNEILNDKSVNDKTIIASVAFGPGLTMSGSILKICRA